MSLFTKIFGDETSKFLKTAWPEVAKINAFEASLTKLSDSELKNRTLDFKKQIADGTELDLILNEAFAVVREASRRTLGERHFDVQLIGGMVIHKRGIAEMRTGEGKTLVATLPAYLNALTGKGVHIVTVNDYLSRRDAVWMGQIYNALGLTVGVINHESSFIYDAQHRNENPKSEAPNSKQMGIKNEENGEKKEDGTGDRLDKTRDELGSFKVVHEFLRPCTRREAYEADITYGTNNEFGFDYLRDNLEYEEKMLRQRDFNYAIVDEIDSILIDEARTPLIISSATTDSENLYVTFAGIVKDFENEKDFIMDEKFHTIQITDAGINKAEKRLNVENIYTDKGIKYVHHLETAVKAHALYRKDKEYVVKNNEVVIVDEFTGRLQPGRRWSEGLHQAIEAKENVSIQKESRTFASITFQNYFRLYRKLAGMTGTALTSKEEFYKVYGLETYAIPTNKSIARKDEHDLIFQSEKGKFMAISKKVKKLQEKGQPVLVGTASIEKNEILSEYFKREGIKHELLNAKNHEREGEIIAQAGRKATVTIATNMAGRGVDIKLGGNPTTKEDAEKVRELGGLFVMGTERHEARRIDNQLRGRSGRQGDPGSTQFYVSLEDNLMRVFAKDMLKGLMGKLGVREDEPIQNGLITRALETAQTKIEGFHFDSRKHVLEYDDVMNHQRKIIYERRRRVLTGGKEAIDEYFSAVLGLDEELEKVIVEKKKILGDDDFYATVRRLILQTTDMFWVEQLEQMDYMRGSVNLRAYGQRDPLVEYKKDGLRLFKDMQESIGRQIREMLPTIAHSGFEKEKAELEKIAKQAKEIGGSSNSTDSGIKSNVPLGQKEPGRNDPCFCGSGKKYKKCHGA